MKGDAGWGAGGKVVEKEGKKRGAAGGWGYNTAKAGARITILLLVFSKSAEQFAFNGAVVD